jgi:hypothetical protein
MAAGHHCQISVGKANGVKNMGYLRFGYSGTSGSDDNYIGLGFHTADDLVKIYPNKIDSLLIHPTGFFIQTTGLNPAVWFGETWVIRGLWGTCSTSAENNLCTITFTYSGLNVNVSIFCKNYVIGNKNLVFNTQPYGFKVTGPNNWIIPMSYQFINAENIEKGGGNYKIIANSATSFTVDSNIGNSTKNDYVLSFSALISDFAAAISAMPYPITYIASWHRMT